MSTTRVIEGLYRIGLGPVNVYLVDYNGLTLIDTDYAGSPEKILTAVRDLGRDPSEIQQIVVSHCHADHAGGLAELKKLTGAGTYAHGEDATLILGDTGVVCVADPAGAPLAANPWTDSWLARLRLGLGGNLNTSGRQVQDRLLDTGKLCSG